MSATPQPAVAGPHGSFARIVTHLSSVHGVMVLAAFVTGPILARVLGVEGRGELAAITAVITMTPWLLDLGLTQWLARERARGGRLDELLGAALPVALACSLVGVVLAVPVSHAIGQDRSVVTSYVQLVLFLAPITVVLQTLLGLAIGESRWGLYTATRILGSVAPAAAIVVLWLADRLTVASAAGIYLASTVLSLLILLPLVGGTRRLVIDLGRIRAAAAFGAKSWLSTIAGAANHRLDQLLMAGLVASSELGLYAVAVSIASLSYGLSISVGSALYPRVAGGDGGLAARACRVTVAIVAVAAAALGVLVVPLVPLVFGEAFAAAVPMVLVLLLASVPLAGAIVLATALNAADAPAAAMRAELVGLGLTVPALIVLLPVGGGMAAAWISLVAYSVRLAMLVRSSRGAFGVRWSDPLVPTRADAGWLRDRVAAGARPRPADRSS